MSGQGRREAKLVVKLQAETAQLTKDLAKAQRRLKSFQGRVSKIGGGIQSSMMAAFGGFAIIQGLRSAITSLANFELAMDKVRAVSGASEGQLADLEKNAKKLGRTTQFTAGQIANLQLQLAKLGLDPTSILESTDAIQNLALVADEDLGESAKSMAGTLNGFNLEADQSNRVANVMAESFSKTALTLEKFTVGTANSSAIANALGITLEQNTARMGKLVSSNIDASKAGTDLRKIYIDLNDKGISYNDALTMIAESSDKVGLATELVGIRAAGALVILSNQREEVEKLTTTLGDNNEELGKMSAIMQDNLMGDWKRFTSAVDGAIQEGSVLNGIFRATTQTFTGLINGIFGASEAYEDYTRAGIDVSRMSGVTLDNVRDLTEWQDRMKIAVKQASAELVDGSASFDQLNLATVDAGMATALMTDRLELYKDSEFYKEIEKEVEAWLKKKAAVEAATRAQEAAYRAGRKLQMANTNLDSMTTDTDVSGINVSKITQGDAPDALNSAQAILDSLKKIRAGMSEEALLMESMMAGLGQNLKMILADIATDIVVNFADAIGSGKGLEAAFKTVLSTMGEGLQKLGKSLVSYGILMLAIQASLKAGILANPAIAIAAGAAAIAAGAALKSAVASASSSASGGGGGRGGGGGGFSADRAGQSVNVQIQGELVADGKSLVAVFNQQNRADSRNVG